jgi:YqaJ-like viral recombinase domain
MKIYDVEQSSPDWLRLRLGIPTASNFDNIVTPTGKLSAQARAYACKLAAETVLNAQLDDVASTEWMQRGKDLEAEAANAWEFFSDNASTKVGFITTDDGQIGCSPDRLVGEDGLLEIKCPAPQTQVGYIVDGMPAKYIPQVQGQLFVTGRKWCDWFAYHPFLPHVCVRVERNEEYIYALGEALEGFNKMKADIITKLETAGAVNKSIDIVSAIQREYGNYLRG